MKRSKHTKTSIKLKKTITYLISFSKTSKSHKKEPYEFLANGKIKAQEFTKAE